jgi:outer membrane protein TolC
LTKKCYEAACDYSDALDRLSVRDARDNIGTLYEKVELARKQAESARAALELYRGANA